MTIDQDKIDSINWGALQALNPKYPRLPTGRPLSQQKIDEIIAVYKENAHFGFQRIAREAKVLLCTAIKYINDYVDKNPNIKIERDEKAELFTNDKRDQIIHYLTNYPQLSLRKIAQACKANVTTVVAYKKRLALNSKSH